jgi:pimeloyl-ACP methyl ester carboxylesterase
MYPSPRRRLLLAALTAVCAAAVVAPAAQAKTVWLCDPDAAGDPCRSSLTATVLAPDGSPGATERARNDRRAPIDCFYVYPTVSDQQTPAATRRVDDRLQAIALYQASRFSQHCRVYAPVYRQITLAGLVNSGAVTPAMRERAYADVRSAWRDYLRNHNRGRGVVLIGHSQGTFVLRRLAAEEVDGKPAVRRRLVSALLIGGGVTVAEGKDVGGDFKRIRACRSATQTGCVVGYSIYGAEPPAGSIFGRAPQTEGGPKLEVLCNNPASLRGGSGVLDSYVATKPFPGTIGALINAQLGELPTRATPWLRQPDSYRGRCQRSGGAHVLRVTPLEGARELVPVPDATWGLHLADMNLAMGNLTDLVESQSKAYLSR